MEFRLFPGCFAVCRLEPQAPVPDWLPAAGFLSVTRTGEELSIICLEKGLPPVKKETGWRLLKLEGPFAFSEIGILAAIAGLLADVGVSILSVGTYDTDYILLKDESLAEALEALRQNGHIVAEPVV